MSFKIRNSTLVAGTTSSALAVAIGLSLFSCKRDSTPQTRVADTQPATVPATGPASKPAKPPEPKYVAAYMDVLRSDFPALPATQPLAIPLNLSEGARLIVKEPLYFDAPGALIWITRPDAPPTDKLLKQAPDDPERIVVTRERVLYVHWLPDAGGAFRPYLVVAHSDESADAPVGTAAGGYDLVCHVGRRKIGSRSDYRWDRAMSYNEKLVVPTATGVSAFRFALDADGRPALGPGGPTPIEEYQDLTDPAATTRPAETGSTVAPGGFAEPQILLDWQGLLAFIPWDPGRQGGRGAARYVNDKWVTLGAAQNWPEHVLHLIPLLDGSIMQFVLTKPSEDAGDTPGAAPAAAAQAGDDPHAWPVKLGVVNLDHAAIDAKKIHELVDNLASDDQDVRDRAYNDLTRYGPAIWPILKELYDDAAPSAQVRMKQLLRNQSAPLLGGMSLLGGDLRLVCRNPDGSAIFYTEKGVQSAGPDGDPMVTAPAWLAVRPGHSVELLPSILTADLKPDKARIASNNDEWIVTADVRGPRRFIGNGFVNLLKKDEAEFSELIGQDRRGRWLFRRPAGTAPLSDAGESPATAPTSGPTSIPSTMPAEQAIETLILDPTLPNLVPRLPVWSYRTADEVGWDKDGWPAVRQLGNVARLTETGWEVAGPDDSLLSRADQAPAVPGPPTTGPAGPPSTQPAATSVFPATIHSAGSATSGPSPWAEPRPTSSPATLPASGSTQQSETAPTTGPGEVPLWADRDGTRYFNGIDELRVVTPTGRSTTWTLPATATGKAPVALVKTADGRLYLFNEPGRVLRLKAAPDGAEPFVIEATFTRNIPDTDHPTRIWLDPAGRIIIAFDKNLAILFPQGYLPPKIRALMSHADDDDLDSP